MRPMAMPLPQDDYYISPEIVGSLDRVQNNEDLYAWLKGPLTEHFVCATPPLPNTGLDRPNLEGFGSIRWEWQIWWR